MIVLFDLDGTLLDHATAEESAARELHREAGLPGNPADFLQSWWVAQERQMHRYLKGHLTFQGQRRAWLRECVKTSLSDSDADQLFGKYLAHYESRWTLFPDVADCLSRLGQHTLGIITNGDSVQQRLKLERTGIDSCFAYVLVSADCGHAKPSPEIFHRACGELRVGASEVVYVGDRYETDAVAARAAGMIGIWLARGRNVSDDHAPPIVRSLRELPELIEGGGRGLTG